jgi:hypothetical protein
VVERNLAKVEVASSTLVSRSSFLFPVGSPSRMDFFRTERYFIEQGAVPKW